MADRFHRRSIRLKGYDYTRAGAYYITVCTHERAQFFGDVTDANMVPNAMGAVVQRCWNAIPEHMPMVVCDAFVVMPNHVHGIVVITNVVGAVNFRPPHGSASVDGSVGAANSPPLRDPGPADDPVDTPPPDDPDRAGNCRPRQIAIMPKNSLGHIMQTFKAAVSRQAVRDGLMPRGTPIWQRGYYERIIRDDAEHDRITRYIADNPRNWKGDRFNR
ncbi:MAG: hypothetical protein IT226_14040 [Flavobacteriales bacterium]|nr:hypothetical protein [Flavobacteriales bacterium]